MVTWFYCDGRSESRTTEPRCILGSILRQLIDRIDRNRLHEVLAYLKEFRSEEKGTAKNKIGETFIKFIVKICATFGKKLFVIVDGIDESPEAKQLSFDMIDLAANFVPTPLVHVLVSSRPETDIERVLCHQVRIHLEKDLVSKDLETHLNWRLDNDESLKKMDNWTKKKVKKALLKSHQGM